MLHILIENSEIFFLSLVSQVSDFYLISSSILDFSKILLFSSESKADIDEISPKVPLGTKR